MRKLLPLLPLAIVGCTSEYRHLTHPENSVLPGPRPWENEVHTDRIRQVSQPSVDVLWVVDDSGSMYDEQVALSANFPVFFDFFDGSGLDFHIGVVSTDMSAMHRSGKLVEFEGQNFIDPDTLDAARIFEGMAMLGTRGSATEKGIDATWTALEVERDGHNAGFLRDDSSVHVVVVSDEGDFSTQVTPNELGAYLNGLRTDPDDVSFSSIVSPQPVCRSAATPGLEYVAVTQMVGGIEWSICDEDWSDVLRRLGIQASGLKREYFLTQLPVPHTIQVTVVDRGEERTFLQDVDWLYDPVRNSIRFLEYVPNPLSEIVIDYVLMSSYAPE